MSTPTVFVIKNQAGQFLNKHQEWVDGDDRQALYRTAHRDEAVNTVFEVSSRDVYLRAEAVACAVDSKGQPLPPEVSDAQPDLIPAAAAEPLAETVVHAEMALSDFSASADSDPVPGNLPEETIATESP